MKYHAACALLLLSLRSIKPVRGELRAAVVSKGQSTSVIEGKQARQLKKSKTGKTSDDASRDDEGVASASIVPGDHQDEPPTVWPTYSPSVFETRSPTAAKTPPLVSEIGIPTPTLEPLVNCDPIGSRVDSPTAPPTEGGPTPVTFRRGDLRKDVDRFGFKVSKGIIVRQVAVADRYVSKHDGQQSKLRFHSSPDGATVLPLDDGGYVYVSNSEVVGGNGGVYGVYFDSKGRVIDYKRLLSGTTRNCSGGTTPWNTFVSCEEYGRGQCWQVDADPSGEHHSKPEQTKLGGDGGNYEAVACDNRNPSQPIFFLSEDSRVGALRRYTPPPQPGTTPGWDTLHVEGGNTDFLFFLDDERFTWTCDESLGRLSAETHFPNVEGINFKGGLLYFVSKRTYDLYVLDLDKGTYKRGPSTNDYELYDGEFQHSPDQLARTKEGHFLYFTEDGGRTAGVYCIDADGQSYTIFEAYSEKYFGDETTGLAFSPDGTRMYAAFQDCGCDTSGDIDCGCLFEFSRDDGRSFDGDTLSLKFHTNEERM